jgi:hypothetical protein
LLIVDNEEGAGVHHRPSKMAGTLDGGQTDGHENRQAFLKGCNLQPATTNKRKYSSSIRYTYYVLSCFHNIIANDGSTAVFVIARQHPSSEPTTRDILGRHSTNELHTVP